MRYRKISAELQEFLESIPDFRRTDKGNIVHNLQDALLLIIVGRLARCVKRKDVLASGMAHFTYLKRLGCSERRGFHPNRRCAASKKALTTRGWQSSNPTSHGR